MAKRSHVYKNMTMETFNLFLEQIKEFPSRIMNIVTAGFGEPLLNPKLPSMIRLLKDSGKVRTVILLTNAVHLNHDISMELINSGLDMIKISINGLNSDDYERICGRQIDYDNLLVQIRFLYENKTNLEMNIKTVGTGLEDNARRSLFFDTFGNICDKIYIEQVAATHKNVDYSRGDFENVPKISKFPEVTWLTKVCPLPFKHIEVSASGKVNFCDAISGFPYDDLNIHKIRLTELWNGIQRKEMLVNLLNGTYQGIAQMCEACTTKHNNTFKEDILEGHEAEILSRMEC
jgi:hypothetical protein